MKSTNNNSGRVISYLVLIIIVIILFLKLDSYLLEIVKEQLNSQMRNLIQNTNGEYKIDIELNRYSDVKAEIIFYLDLDNEIITNYYSKSYTESNPYIDTKAFGLDGYNRGYGNFKAIWDGRFKNFAYIQYNNNKRHYTISIGINSDTWDASGNMKRIAFGEEYAFLHNKINIETDIITAENYSFFEKIWFLLRKKELSTNVFNSNSSCDLEQQLLMKKTNDNDFKFEGKAEKWRGKISVNRRLRRY